MNTEKLEAAILTTIEDQIKALLSTHWHRIKEIREGEDAEGVVAIAFGIGVDCAGKNPLVKTKIAYSKRFKDEVEEVIDADQGKLFEE